jgi:hypothetical protein
VQFCLLIDGCGSAPYASEGRQLALHPAKRDQGSLQPTAASSAQPHRKLSCWLQYAGNVLVYGASSACNGDWFGGVNADNVEEFLEALLAAKVRFAAGHRCGSAMRGGRHCSGPTASDALLDLDGQRALDVGCWNCADLLYLLQAVCRRR